MAIAAFNPMNVVRACGAEVGRVHLFYVKTAVRHLGMAGLAGGASGLLMPVMARKTAQPLVHAEWRAIITRSGLHSPSVHGRRQSRLRRAGRVALVADRLPWILADMKDMGTVRHLRKGEVGRRKVHLLAAIIESQ